MFAKGVLGRVCKEYGDGGCGGGGEGCGNTVEGGMGW